VGESKLRVIVCADLEEAEARWHEWTRNGYQAERPEWVARVDWDTTPIGGLGEYQKDRYVIILRKTIV
jgi:hypothetical protein